MIFITKAWSSWCLNGVSEVLVKISLFWMGRNSMSLVWPLESLLSPQLWLNPFANSLQKLLVPTLLPLWLANSRYFCNLEQVALPPWLSETAVLLGQKMPPGRKPGGLRASALVFPFSEGSRSFAACGPVPETAALYVLSSFIVLQLRVSSVPTVLSWLEAEIWQFACKLCLPH